MATRELEPTVRATGRFPCFDGLRALAALSIVVVHVSAYSGADGLSGFRDLLQRMDAGVAIFFVLSGFLLYRPFVAAHLHGRAQPATRPYLWRRFLRIYPAYLVVLTVVVYVFGAPGGCHGPPRTHYSPTR